MNKEKVILPEGYDPYDKALKKLFHEKADKLNYIGQPSGYPQLLCGAVRKGKLCHVAAGRGTSHSGYGRCRYHGGVSTGPKTYEGKAHASQNSRKHGFFASAVTQEEHNMAIQLMGDISLTFEITLWKTKITRYLRRNADKWKQAYDERIASGEITAAEYADMRTRKVCSEYIDNYKGPRTLSYHVGTIEDKVLMKALDVLGRLIEVQSKLNMQKDESANDLINQINIELQVASYGQVSFNLEAE